MMKLFLAFCLISCASLSGQTSSGSKPAHTGANGKLAAKSAPVAHAEWTELAQSFAGITRKQFDDVGLGKLTKDDFSALELAIYEIRQEGVEASRKLQTTYVCGPIPANYDKVRLYINVSEKTPAEVSSGVRQRLRALSDVEVVYSPIEADTGVEIMGYENYLEGGRKTGYSASAITYDPCKASLGDKEWAIRVMNNHYTAAAGTASDLIDSVVSDLDTNDLESTRAFHSAVKKAGVAK